jgi:uncharacterized membrane protein
MWFLPISLALFLLFLLLIPVLFALAPAVAFAKLGLNSFLGYAFVFLCFLGGSINIPISREELPSYEPIVNRRITSKEFIEAVNLPLKAGLTRLDGVTL